MPRTVQSVVAAAPTSVDTAPPGSLQYPNRRWVRHAPLGGGLTRACGCGCDAHRSEEGRLCAGEDGIIYGVAYHCEHCRDDLCAACYTAGYAHHQHRCDHRMVDVQPPLPSLQPPPGCVPFSAPPASPRSTQRLQGVHRLTYDSYEADVYNDARDCLVFYHRKPHPPQPDQPLSSIVQQVSDEVQQARDATTNAGGGKRARVDGQAGRWSGADAYAYAAHGRELDVLAATYLPWLVEQLTAREGELQHTPLVAVMDGSSNWLDWDWMPRPHQQLFPCFILHPAMPHKGHAAFAERNRKWQACYTATVDERCDHSGDSTPKWHPLFQPEFALPSLDAFLTWLSEESGQPLPLEHLLSQAVAVRSAVDWVRRGAVAALQLSYLVAVYGHQLQLERLEPPLAAAADDMRQLVGVERRYAGLLQVDYAWCEQHVPAVEQLVSEWMSSPPMRAAREAWVKKREAHLSQHPYVAPPRRRELHDSDPTGLVVELDNASFAHVVLDNGSDVLVGMWEDDNNSFTRNLGLCCRVLLPAIARLLQRVEPHTARSATDAAGSSTSATHPPPSSLVLAVKAPQPGGPHERMHRQWMDLQVYQQLIQRSLGALVLYPAGAKPHDDDYGFYTLYEDVYTAGFPAVRQQIQPAQSYGTFVRPLRLPTLSALCRWLHANMRGSGRFDLQAVLALAAQYEEASRLLDRVSNAFFDSVEASIMQLLPDIDEDKEESQWPADTRVGHAIGGAYHACSSMTLEQLAEPAKMAEITAATEAWEALMPRFRQTGAAAMQAMNEEAAEDDDD